MTQYESIRRLLEAVRSRWRELRALQAVVRAGLAVSAIVALTLLLTRAFSRSPLGLTLVGVGALVAIVVAVIWGFAPLGRPPGDVQVARYIEERRPDLDDRLATAVDVMSSSQSRTPPAFAGPMVEDAARRADRIDPKQIVPGSGLRRGWFRAAGVSAVLIALAFVSSGSSRRIFDAAVMTVFPSRVTLQVAPGNVRIKTGSPLGINARLVGTRADVVAQVEMTDGDRWHTVDMTQDPDGRFRLRIDSVNAAFKYRVLAGSVTSPTYSVAVANAPRVTRIDLDYTYPEAFGSRSRRDEDAGDIYAPSGTTVQLHVHTDRPTPVAVMVLDNGQRVPLVTEAPDVVTGSLTLAADGSYRVALAGSDGLINNGDTEYFIRLLETRPPDVRILRPAADRSVTRSDEIEIEAEADDDRGVGQLELVVATRGDQHIVPMSLSGPNTSVKGQATLAMPHLGVDVGDVVSYFVRARETGTAKAVARSDLHFLEVKAPEGAGRSSTPPGGKAGAVDDLVAAQKQIVATTWKLDRRADNASHTRSAQDIRTLSAGEADLKKRVENLLPGESEMVAAARSMAEAISWLDQLKTTQALPPETDALGHLLKARAIVRRREVAAEQSGRGKTSAALSSLFDELQQSETTNAGHESAAERLKEMIGQQKDLLKRQQALTRDRTDRGEDALKRELEKLAAEQAELRQRLEDLERQQENGGQSAENARRMRQAAGEMRDAANDLRRADASESNVDGQKALDMLRELAEKMEGEASSRRPKNELEAQARQLADGQRQIADQVSKLGRTNVDKQATQWLATEEEQLAARLRSLQQRLKQPGADNARARDVMTAASRELERQRLADRMQRSAEALRTADDPSMQAGPESDIAQSLDRVADTLATAGGGPGGDAQRAANELSQVQQLRERLDEMGRQLDEMNRQRQNGRGASGGGGMSAADLDRLRQQFARDMKQARDLLAQVQHDDPAFMDGGAGGLASEGQGLVQSAAGDEAFKQDLEKWEQLRLQINRALELAASSLARRLTREGHERLAAGLVDRAPADYQKRVDNYFKALAVQSDKKTP